MGGRCPAHRQSHSDPRGNRPMTRKMMRAKIHRATVTQADVDYEGSITIDRRLLDATDLLPNEAVCVWNVSNGTRFETYAVEGPPDSGVICVNGAAAHLVSSGDLVIIAAFTWMDEDAARRHQPKVVFVDEHNRIREKRAEVPGPGVARSAGASVSQRVDIGFRTTG